MCRNGAVFSPLYCRGIVKGSVSFRFKKYWWSVWLIKRKMKLLYNFQSLSRSRVLLRMLMQTMASILGSIFVL